VPPTGKIFNGVPGWYTFSNAHSLVPENKPDENRGI
jgi:hypothetical protein